MTDIWAIAAQFGSPVFLALVVMVAYQKLAIKLITVIEASAKVDAQLMEVVRTNTEVIRSGSEAIKEMAGRLERLENTVARSRE